MDAAPATRAQLHSATLKSRRISISPSNNMYGRENLDFVSFFCFFMSNKTWFLVYAVYFRFWFNSVFSLIPNEFRREESFENIELVALQSTDLHCLLFTANILHVLSEN